MDAVLLGPHPGNHTMSTVNYFRFFADHLPPWLPGWEIRASCPGKRRPSHLEGENGGAIRRRWENYVQWPLRLTQEKGDLAHIIDQGLAWYGDFLGHARKLITVHDLIEYMKLRKIMDFGPIPQGRGLLVRKCISQITRADHLVSVSECTAGHLVSLLDIPASKITVLPNVVDNDFFPLTPKERCAARQKWFGDSEYVVIHVGKASSYKNRIGALRAFDRLRRQLSGARMFLVHGAPDPEEAVFLGECESRAEIYFLPPISRAGLREFYGAADVLIFPSLYEGFGWPPLEAMACGCPVVCTTRGSLKEVVSDAAITVNDPYAHDALAGALRVVLRDGAAALDLRSRGLRRVKEFAPSRILPQMAEVYRRVNRGT